ncbi:lymphocyte antigen 6E-like, partial [Columba livia]
EDYSCHLAGCCPVCGARTRVQQELFDHFHCAKEDKYCVTIRNSTGIKPDKPKYVISKMCSPTCPATQNQTYQRVSCCEKPLCNVNGVSSKQSSSGVMSLGVLASITYIFACGL